MINKYWSYSLELLLDYLNITGPNCNLLFVVGEIALCLNSIFKLATSVGFVVRHLFQLMEKLAES